MAVSHLPIIWRGVVWPEETWLLAFLRLAFEALLLAFLYCFDAIWRCGHDFGHDASQARDCLTHFASDGEMRGVGLGLIERSGAKTPGFSDGMKRRTLGRCNQPKA